MSDHGFPITKNQLLDSVQLILKAMDKSTPFIDNRPGRHWYDGFKSRHSELCQRMSQNLLNSRAAVSEEKIRGWFSQLNKDLEKEGLRYIDGSRIFNTDESAFLLCPTGDKVLVQKGDKQAYSFVSNDPKECVTTLFCGNARGDMIPPMTVFNYARIPKHVASQMPRGWGIGCTKTGWETAESFLDWMKQIFCPWIKDFQIVLPVILYVDGHSSHMSIQLSDFCRDNQIILIALYPNATHILQPMDVAVFGPLKKIWRKVVRDWRMNNDGRRLKRENFGLLLKEALDGLDIKSILSNGFRACGLYPFSADAVNYAKYFKTSQSSISTPLPSKSDSVLTHLEFIESNIENEILKIFKDVRGDLDWTGPENLEALFYFWRKIYNMETFGDSRHLERLSKNQLPGDNNQDHTSARSKITEPIAGDNIEVCLYL